MTDDGADDAHWLLLIGDMLDQKQRKLVEARCEEIRQEFRASVGDELAVEQRRIVLRRIQRGFAQSASDVCGIIRQSDDLRSLQDHEWLPYAGGYSGPASSEEWPLKLPSTEIALLLQALSKQAERVADSLVTPSLSPAKEVTAVYTWMLWEEFPPRRQRLGRSLVRPPSRSKLPELASYLYAYFTGIADENMEWPCRRALSLLKSRRA
jgi:hypothetical protein